MATDVPHADLAHDEELVRDLARAVLARAAPEELVLFEESAADYFADPRAVLDPKRRDEAVGFGLDLALLTPYVLAVASPVLAFLVQTVAGAVKEESQPLLRRLVRRLFRLEDADGSETASPSPSAPPAITTEQAARVREIAYARAGDLGLPPEQARVLADSVVGGLVTAGP